MPSTRGAPAGTWPGLVEQGHVLGPHPGLLHQPLGEPAGVVDGILQQVRVLVLVEADHDRAAAELCRRGLVGRRRLRSAAEPRTHCGRPGALNEPARSTSGHALTLSSLGLLMSLPSKGVCESPHPRLPRSNICRAVGPVSCLIFKQAAARTVN